MRAQVLFISAAAASALAVGWLTPPPTTPPVEALHPLRVKSQASIVRPGSQASPAADYLAALNPPPPPPPPPPRPLPPPPPPPDVAKLLQGAVTAVVQDRQGLGLVVATAPGSPGRRTLHIGDDVFDGWRVADLSRRDVVLQKGAEQRRVSFFTAPDGA